MDWSYLTLEDLDDVWMLQRPILEFALTTVLESRKKFISHSISSPAILAHLECSEV